MAPVLPAATIGDASIACATMKPAASRAWLLPLLLAAAGCSMDSPPDAPPPTGTMSGPPATDATGTAIPPARREAVPPRGMSRQDDCRGPAELCKQDSAR